MSKIKRLVEFNIENAKFALKNASGYDAPIEFNYATKFAKQSNSSSQDLYGDGRVRATFVSDQSLTGTLGLTAIDNEYEIAMGRRMEVSGGVADIAQTKMVEHAIYIETNVADDGEAPVIAKTWYFGVTSTRPDETTNQNTESLNFEEVEYPLTIRGTILKTADGEEDYVDPNTGKKVYVYSIRSLPTDDNYSTFGDSVPTLTAKE